MQWDIFQIPFFKQNQTLQFKLTDARISIGILIHILAAVYKNQCIKSFFKCEMTANKEWLVIFFFVDNLFHKRKKECVFFLLHYIQK